MSRRPNAGAKLLSVDGRRLEEAAFLNKLLPGRRVGVYYPDDDLWHERLLLYPVVPKTGEWYVLTPDDDVYVENVAANDDEGCTRAFMCGPDRERPQMAARKFYRFRDWPGAKIVKSHILDCRRLVEGSEHEAVDPTRVVTPLGPIADFSEFIGVKPRPARGKQPPTTPVREKPARHSIATPGEEADEAEDGDDDERKEPETEVERKGGDPGGGKLAGRYPPKRAKGGPASVDDDEEEDEGAQWLAMETAFGVEVHSAVTMGPKDLKAGNRGIHEVADGQFIAVYKARNTNLEEDRPWTGNAAGSDGHEAKTLDDARLLLPMKYDNKGRRWLTFDEGHRLLAEEIMEDWPLNGERTTSWLFNFVRDHGGTFDSRHTKFVMEQRWEKDSMPALVHDLVGFALELSLCYDQVDCSNLASLEVLSRLYQVLEESSGSLQMEGLEHYIGRDRTAGLRKGIALAPGLARHAVGEQSKETAILKEQRKAREEKESAKKDKKGGGGKGGAKGAAPQP